MKKIDKILSFLQIIALTSFLIFFVWKSLQIYYSQKRIKEIKEKEKIDNNFKFLDDPELYYQNIQF